MTLNFVAPFILNAGRENFKLIAACWTVVNLPKFNVTLAHSTNKGGRETWHFSDCKGPANTNGPIEDLIEEH